MTGPPASASESTRDVDDRPPSRASSYGGENAFSESDYSAGYDEGIAMPREVGQLKGRTFVVGQSPVGRRRQRSTGGTPVIRADGEFGNGGGPRAGRWQ